MPRSGWPVGLIFGLSLAVVVSLVGPLLLFNPLFTSALQVRHEVAADFGTTRAEVDRVTAEILVDLYADGSFDAAFEGGEPLLDERERSHMHDVAVLVRVLVAVALVAAVLAAVSGAWLRGERSRLGRLMLFVAGGIGVVAVVLALLFAVAFEPTFLAFHRVFFPPGTYLFEPGSELITLFPQGFWFDAALAAGGAIILSALLVGLVGLRLRRASPATPGRA
jgi:integral membrane protein (TIGR01906 family)